jgi:sterol desaturase/sphingolipid hydroxylase (fatty acid hydroxylase superfamily)
MKIGINKELAGSKYFRSATIGHICSFFTLFYVLYSLNAGMFRFWFTQTPAVWQAYNNFFQINSLLVVLGLNVFFLSCYIFKFKFIEKFKVNNLEWPWIENPGK